MKNLFTLCWDRNRVHIQERAPMIPAEHQQKTIYEGLAWFYMELFKRNGFLSAAPFFPAPRILKESSDGSFDMEAASTEVTKNKLEIYYPWIRDSIEKTLSFFLAQSFSSSLAIPINKLSAPQGQQFDISLHFNATSK